MKYKLLQWLSCPNCGGQELNLEVVSQRETPVYASHVQDGEGGNDSTSSAGGVETEVEEGALHCKQCGLIYPIREGIPRMVVGEAGDTTQHRMTQFDMVAPIWEAHFLDLSGPLSADDFLGKTVVDLGCGYGRHAYFAARYGAQVIAIDNSEDAALSTQKNTAHLRNVHVVQADGAALPLKSQVIDRVYCYGVLHHAKDPNGILKNATDCLKPGGSFSLWVYGPRQGLTLMINNALRGVTTNMDHDTLLRLSRTIARGLRLFSHTPYRWFGEVPFAKSIVSHLPVHDHHKWPFEVVVSDIYDRLRIPVRRWFTKEEIERWYADNGYSDFHVRRRVKNNETFCGIGIRR